MRKLIRVNKGQQSYRDYRSQSLMGRMKHGCRSGTNFKLKLIQQTLHLRKHLGLKQLCFNCTGSRHRASECKFRSGCQICSRRHHTSICDKPTSRDQMMTTTSVERKGVVYPMVTVDVNCFKCRALLDTGAGISFASSTLRDCQQFRQQLSVNNSSALK